MRTIVMAFSATFLVLATASTAMAATNQEIVAALEKGVTLEFDDAHVGDVLEELADRFQINIVLDNRAVAPRNPDDADVQADYATTGIIPFIKLDDVPLKQFLQALLRPLNLDYSVQPEFIWVSTHERIQHESFERLETRTYSVNGKYIVDANEYWRGLSELRIELMWLLNRIVPEVLDPGTGEPISSIAFDEKANKLTVQQIPSHHEKVQRLLDAIETTD